MAIELFIRQLGLVSNCGIPYLPEAIMLSPLHGFAFR
jgi:hypothetical protein